MIRHKVLDHIVIQTEANIKEDGKMTYNMEKENNHGLMEVVIKVSIFKEKNKDRVNITGRMEVGIVETGKIIKLQGLVAIFGEMEENIKDSG